MLWNRVENKTGKGNYSKSNDRSNTLSVSDAGFLSSTRKLIQLFQDLGKNESKDIKKGTDVPLLI